MTSAKRREIWLSSAVMPGRIREIARRTEDAGWDGLVFGDTQTLWAETMTSLALAASITSRIGLGTAVVNPVTRHPSVVASAVCTLQAEFPQRLVLGLGRGDSSLSRIGEPRPRISDFTDYVQQMRRYVAGQRPTLDLAPIRWVEPLGVAPPSVEVAVSGPRTAAAVAPSADGVMLAVGAQPRRIQRLIQLCTEARTAAGCSNDDFTFTAFVQVCTHPNINEAYRIISGSVALYARFSSGMGESTRPLTDLDTRDRPVIERLQREYRSDEHGANTRDAAHLDRDFIDRFAIVGSPAECAERLNRLFELGLSRVIVLPSGRSLDSYEEGRLSEERLAREVVPRVDR